MCLGQSVARPGRTLKNIDFKLSSGVYFLAENVWGSDVDLLVRLINEGVMLLSGFVYVHMYICAD